MRRSSGSVETSRRAQMVLLAAQEMDVAQIAKVALIRRYIAWRNRHADNQARELVKRANVA